MSRYEAKPWLAAYEDRMKAAETPKATTILASFRRAVHRSPQATAIAYFDATMSYREVDELSDGVARHLLASGFAPGDRLALVLQNIPQFVLALLGAWKAGGIVVPVNPDVPRAGTPARLRRRGGARGRLLAERMEPSHPPARARQRRDHRADHQ